MGEGNVFTDVCLSMVGGGLPWEGGVGRESLSWEGVGLPWEGVGLPWEGVCKGGGVCMEGVCMENRPTGDRYASYLKPEISHAQTQFFRTPRGPGSTTYPEIGFWPVPVLNLFAQRNLLLGSANQLVANACDGVWQLNYLCLTAAECWL